MNTNFKPLFTCIIILKTLKINIGLLLVVCFFQSCRGIKHIPVDYSKQHPGKRNSMIAVFMDGTRDAPQKKSWKNTHVKTFHSLAFPDFPSLYLEGVGARMRLRHTRKAITTDKRIMKAYRFISINYQPGDSICLLGFSRGANQCRILASFIYTIGIINVESVLKEEQREPFLLKLYALYESKNELAEKREAMVGFIKNWEQEHPGKKIYYDVTGTTPIELLALWDTVEALEIGDREEKLTPVSHHLNQLYNIRRFYHAVSLDDNRAFNYSPIIATHREVGLHPGQSIDSVVEEVYFNGSHKDVGGGVKSKRRNQICEISAKWMYEKIKPYRLLRDTVFVANIYGKVNNARSSIIGKLSSPKDTLRGIDKYWTSMSTNYNGHKIKVHQSVISRLEKGYTQPFKNKRKNGVRADWYTWKPFKNCFKRKKDESDKWVYEFQKNDCNCITVVDEKLKTKEKAEKW